MLQFRSRQGSYRASGPLYFRTSKHRKRNYLPPEDLSDLSAYLGHLRAYYGIPEGQPVFIDDRDEAKSPSRSRSGSKNEPRARGKNRADHPWRGTL